MRNFANGLRWIAAFSLFFITAALFAQPEWITAPGLDPHHPVVLHFRRDLNLSNKPESFPVSVSADNRFVLYVNGQRVAAGPARGDLLHWRYEQVDLAQFLHRGHNVIAAEVWNAVTPDATILSWTAPLAQISARTGFWVKGSGSNAALIESGPQWKVAIQNGHDFSSPFMSLVNQLGRTFYAASGQESIDGARTDWNWAGPELTGAGWVDAVSALSPGEKAPWTLEADLLPQMEYQPTASGTNVRTDQTSAGSFPTQPTVIPPNHQVHILLDHGVMVSAYPHLTVSGGAGSKVEVTYAEALYKGKQKGDRSDIQGRNIIGLTDTFLPDGSADRRFSPLWWRTWRYMQLTITTRDQPLTLDQLDLDETGYPFKQIGSFISDDLQLNDIWNIGWRTQRIDAHETFMDSSYWEQLQYTGDTRIQMLIVYALTGDARLPVQAIDAFGDSQHEDGLTEGAYPSRIENLIPPFSLLWINMMHDYWMQQPDTAVLTRNLARARKITNWYSAYVAENGLLKNTPNWSFVDWVGSPPIARSKFPSFDPSSNTSCLTSLFYLGALKDEADLENALGDKSFAGGAQSRANALTQSLRDHCWDSTRKLFADDPSKTIFSQHTNALAVLYDVAPKEDQAEILANITLPKGIEAPPGILETSYYFSWYLIRAFEHAGLTDHYLDMLTTWRDLTKLHFTTWPEERGNTRSDTHAWSAHPTADLLGIVAGIEPSSAGYRTVRIAPHPSSLHYFQASAATPKGVVSVGYKRLVSKADFQIRLPAGLIGTFLWQGSAHELHSGKNHLRLSASSLQ